MIKILIGEKQYLSGRITAYMSREALKINKESMDLLDIQKKIEKNKQEDIQIDGDTARKLLDALDTLSDRKARLVCSVFENQFSYDDLIKGLSDAEIDKAVTDIFLASRGILQKN